MTAPVAAVAPAGGAPELSRAKFSLKTPAVAAGSTRSQAPLRALITAPVKVKPVSATEARVDKVVERVRVAQEKLDHILKLAQSGKTFTPAELLALQGQVYRSSQEIDLSTRVVEKGAGGVKQVLQTQT